MCPESPSPSPPPFFFWWPLCECVRWEQWGDSWPVGGGCLPLGNSAACVGAGRTRARVREEDLSAGSRPSAPDELIMALGVRLPTADHRESQRGQAGEGRSGEGGPALGGAGALAGDKGLQTAA
jgi:hypothetical protein